MLLLSAPPNTIVVAMKREALDMSMKREVLDMTMKREVLDMTMKREVLDMTLRHVRSEYLHLSKLSCIGHRPS